MNDRLVELRKKHLKMTQADFAKRLKLSQGAIGNYELGTRPLNDRTISDICREFGVNESWLRSGEGEIFAQPESFSLDEFARSRGASDLDLEIAKAYFDMPPDLRHAVIEHFKNYLSKEKMPPVQIEQEASEDIEAWAAAEAEAYRLELIAEKEAETSPVLGNIRPKNA